MAKEDHYEKRYGNWAGLPSGHAPDFKRCCKSLRDRYHPGGYQCNRKNGHGPDGAYCKQHDPVAVKARDDAAKAKYDAKFNADRYRWHGREFYHVLEQIAAGHNDARGLAQEVIDKFKAGER